MNKEQLDNYYHNIFDNKPDGLDISVLKIVLPLTLIQKEVMQQNSLLLEKKYDLTLSQINLLSTLLFNDMTMSPTQLSQSMVFSSGGMTKLLKSLESRELIERIESSQDRRSMLVQLSPKGKAMCKKAIPDLLESDHTIFSTLDSSEQEQLAKILKKLVYTMVS